MEFAYVETKIDESVWIVDFDSWIDYLQDLDGAHPDDTVVNGVLALSSPSAVRFQPKLILSSIALLVE